MSFGLISASVSGCRGIKILFGSYIRRHWHRGLCPDPNTTYLCQVVKRLPKTRSGKVMRRLLRKIITSKGQDLGDTTTLEDPSVISEILSAFQKYEDQRAATK